MEAQDIVNTLALLGLLALIVVVIGIVFISPWILWWALTYLGIIKVAFGFWTYIACAAVILTLGGGSFIRLGK